MLRIRRSKYSSFRFKKKGKKEKNTTKSIPIKKVNIGIQILRMLCCLVVIGIHCYGYPSRILQEYIYSMFLFFFISFYFSYNTLSSRKSAKIKERIKRIIIPYVGWPLILYAYNNIDNSRKPYDLKTLYYQILIGAEIYGIFWFLFNLLLLTIFFTLMNYIFKKLAIVILFILCVFVYLFFYSGKTDEQIFNHYKLGIIQHSIRPLFQKFIFVYTGYLFGSFNLINKLYRIRIISIIISFSVIYIFVNYYDYIFSKVSSLYKGLVQEIFVINIFIFFAMLPFDKIDDKYINIILNTLTNYTGGIYYLHVMMAHYFQKFIYVGKRIDLEGCIKIYLYCYVVCFIGNIVFKNHFLKFLFI